MSDNQSKEAERKPLVSAIIPVYKGESFIHNTIESVLKQSYKNIEIICIDDGSPDNSAQVIHSFGDKVRYFHQENQGVAYARTHGLKVAKGEYIAFLDQDDWWLETKIEKQVKAIQADANVGLVHTAVQTFDQSTKQFRENINPNAKPERLVGMCFLNLFKENHIYNSSVLVSKAIVDELNGIDLNIEGNTCQDYDLWLRVAKRAAFSYLDEELVVYRVHSEQGHLDRRGMLTQELAVLSKNIQGTGLEKEDAVVRRQAVLTYWLGIAYLDHGDISEARRLFRKSLSMRMTKQAWSVFIACLLPHFMVKKLRKA
ncbi:glycosyltransferase family 2 protein [Ningiella sp. W23]|uniref:glycosyltransferase family 2 protein n=1 Tax=Ningiella sp. W23 TaxID=3023715 RepID=UPI0037576809